MKENERGENYNLETLKSNTDKTFRNGINSEKFFEKRIEREWLTTQQAAHFLSLSSNALRIMVHRDQIRVYKLGRRLRFRLEDCLALFQTKGA